MTPDDDDDLRCAPLAQVPRQQQEEPHAGRSSRRSSNSRLSRLIQAAQLPQANSSQVQSSLNSKRNRKRNRPTPQTTTNQQQAVQQAAPSRSVSAATTRSTLQRNPAGTHIPCSRTRGELCRIPFITFSDRLWDAEGGVQIDDNDRPRFSRPTLTTPLPLGLRPPTDSHETYIFRIHIQAQRSGTRYPTEGGHRLRRRRTLTPSTSTEQTRGRRPPTASRMPTLRSVRRSIQQTSSVDVTDRA